VVFCAVWAWRWHRREFQGKGEAFLMENYTKSQKKEKPDPEAAAKEQDVKVVHGRTEFATIDVAKNDEKAEEKKQQIEMTEQGKSGLELEVEKNSENVVSGNDADPEIGVDVQKKDEEEERNEQHDEDDEKAEEIVYDRTLTGNDGEEIEIGDDD